MSTLLTKAGNRATTRAVRQDQPARDPQFPFWPEYKLFQSKFPHVVCICSARYTFDGRKVRRHLSSGRFELEADHRKRIVPASIPRIRLFRGELFAEIIEDRRNRPRIVLCVIQRHDSPEILFLGQFHSQGEAKLAGEQFMSDYLSRSGKPRADWQP
jgi:hypothetical protein